MMNLLHLREHVLVRWEFSILGEELLLLRIQLLCKGSHHISIPLARPKDWYCSEDVR
jgi:hypothetical protein